MEQKLFDCQNIFPFFIFWWSLFLLFTIFNLFLGHHTDISLLIYYLLVSVPSTVSLPTEKTLSSSFLFSVFRIPSESAAKIQKEKVSLSLLFFFYFIRYSADAFLLFYVFLFVFTFSFSFFLYPHTLSPCYFSQIFTTGTFPYFCFCHKYIFLLLQLFALTDH